MTRPTLPNMLGLALRENRKESYFVLAISDTIVGAGLVSGLCALLGMFDDIGDSVVLAVASFCALVFALLLRANFVKQQRPTTATVLSSLTASWLTLVGYSAVIYLFSGTIDRIDNALVESAAGFSTTAVSTLNVTELTLTMTLWRAATQWLGGLLGLIAGVVVLPIALQRWCFAPAEWIINDEFARSKKTRTRQVLAIYSALTVVFFAAYGATQMGVENSLVFALTTVSTGGFSTAVDSFASFGFSSIIVSTLAMAVAGTGYAVIFWAIRGRVKPLLHSVELRVYAALLLLGALWVWLASNTLAWYEALFTAASALSTTGFTLLDWTTDNTAVSALLLVLIATGAMIGSPAGGLTINRARILVAFARRELRRQLNYSAVILLKSGGRVVDERALERISGFQIAHIGICFIAAFVLASAGLDWLDAIYTGISVLSTHGPGVGIGAFGDLSNFSQLIRVALVPLMLLGHLSLVPLMLVIVWVVNCNKSVRGFLRRRVTRQSSSRDWGLTEQQTTEPT